MDSLTLVAQGLYAHAIYPIIKKPWEDLPDHTHRHWEDIAQHVLDGWDEMQVVHKENRNGYETFDVIGNHFDIQFGTPAGKLSDRKIIYESR